MKRSLLGIGLFLLLFALACSPQPPPAANEVDSEEVETIVDADPAEEPVVAEPEDEGEAADESAAPSDSSEEEMEDEEEDEEEMEEMAESDGVEMVESVDSPFSSPNFPAVQFEDAIVERSFDKVKGADDPLITIIEYGDFQ